MVFSGTGQWITSPTQGERIGCEGVWAQTLDGITHANIKDIAGFSCAKRQLGHPPFRKAKHHDHNVQHAMTMGEIQKSLTGIQFAVSDVEPNTKRLSDISVKAAIERTTRTRIQACPNEDERLLAQGDFHPLIASAFLAFKQHCTLVLSPDLIWLTVLQGVSQHVQNHAERLRKRLVRHNTKIELVATVTSLPRNDSEMLALTKQFLARMTSHVCPEKQFLFRTEFSTTKDVDRIGASVVLMESFRRYFDYVAYCICGIPSVVLEGTPRDWQLLSDRVERLHESDLELTWWTEHLLPLCDHFVRASQGDVDRDHWQDLCKLTADYGTDVINGWIVKFIPYLKNGENEPAIHRNPLLEPPDLRGTDLPVLGGRDAAGRIRSCTSAMLPSGLSHAPVSWKHVPPGVTVEVQFVSGLIGVRQAEDGLSLRAITGWSISEDTLIARAIAKMRLQGDARPPVGTIPTEMEIFNSEIPADVFRFYSETDGAELSVPNTSLRCRILPLAEIGPIWESNIGPELMRLRDTGELSPQDYATELACVRKYGRLLRIAELSDGTCYVVGRDPEIRLDTTVRQHDVPPLEERNLWVVLHWSGARIPEAFTVVATSFGEFLASVCDTESAGRE